MLVGVVAELISLGYTAYTTHKPGNPQDRYVRAVVVVGLQSPPAVIVLTVSIEPFTFLSPPPNPVTKAANLKDCLPVTATSCCCGAVVVVKHLSLVDGNSWTLYPPPLSLPHHLLPYNPHNFLTTHPPTSSSSHLQSLNSPPHHLLHHHLHNHHCWVLTAHSSPLPHQPHPPSH